MHTDRKEASCRGNDDPVGHTTPHRFGYSHTFADATVRHTSVLTAPRVDHKRVRHPGSARLAQFRPPSTTGGTMRKVKTALYYVSGYVSCMAVMTACALAYGYITHT